MSKEAMKLALEALTNAPLVNWRMDEAVDAIEEALAQPELKIDMYRSFEQWKSGNVLEHGVPRTEYYNEAQLDLVEMGWNYGYDAGRAVEQALDKMAENARELGLDYEPEQESVTWRNAAIRVGEDLCSVGPFRYYDMTAEQWLDWALSVVTVHAPPPQRTWIGLTDGEVDKMILLMGFPPDWITENAIVKNIVRNLEAKIKEKNT